MVATNAPVESARTAWQHVGRDPVRENEWLRQLENEGIATDVRGEAALEWLVASVEPTTGDPQLVAVYPDPDKDGFWIDRRTMRIQQAPADLVCDEQAVMRAGDLVDRVQLCLGEPVWLALRQTRERFVITALRKLAPRFQFTNASYRMTAPLMATPGTLAPLSIDALERALKLEVDRGDEPRIRRLFGQAYRRIDEHHTPWALRNEGKPQRSIFARMARLGRDVTLALTDAERFRRMILKSAPRLEAVDLTKLDTEDLLDALRERMALVVEALALLERSRLATLSLLPAIELTTGVLPRPVFAALAAPARTKERRAVDEKLLALADVLMTEHGALRVPTTPRALQEWSRVRGSLRHVRILGMDVRPDAMGADDAHLLHAVKEAKAERDADAERARTRAERDLLVLTSKGAFGPLGIGPSIAQMTLLSRLAKAKGAVAEALSIALLSLRAAALEAGRRLVNDALLDAPDDALYMPLDEIEQALEGELGAYAARVRLRREDDTRFRYFTPPRRVPGRRL